MQVKTQAFACSGRATTLSHVRDVVERPWQLAPAQDDLVGQGDLRRLLKGIADFRFPVFADDHYGLLAFRTTAIGTQV